MTYKNRALIANLIGGLLAAAAATAAPAQTGPTIRVHYSYSELRTQEGAHNVYKRIKSAAKRACSMPSDYWQTTQACSRELVALAVDKLGDPTVLAMSRGKSTQIATR